MESLQELKDKIALLEQGLKASKSIDNKKNVINCKWYVQSGRKCKNRGLRNGYCFMHENEFKYYPQGIKDNEDNYEPCTNNGRKKFIPSNIRQLDDEFLSGIIYYYRNQKYTVENVYDTYAIFKLKDNFINDTLTVWNSREDKKNCKGIIINQIYGFREFECEERATVDMSDDTNKYCTDCFEDVCKTLIDSIQ